MDSLRTCPVCGAQSTGEVCAACGFDNSRNYEQYPTLAPIPKRTASVTARRKKWTRAQNGTSGVRTTTSGGPMRAVFVGFVLGVVTLLIGIAAGWFMRGVVTIPLWSTAELIASGTSDTGLNWRLDADGVLRISGTGPMHNFSGSPSATADNAGVDWWDYRKQIVTVVIQNGVTSIGAYAFERCTSLTNITIPDSVTSIGYVAFENCTSLTNITIPDSVTSIGAYAFYGCTSLTDVYYGGTEEQWNAIDISGYANRAALTGATIHYNAA